MIIAGRHYGIRLEKGISNLMIYVGINISKLNLFTSAISSDGKVLIEQFKITFNNDGFQLMLSELDSFEKDSICKYSINKVTVYL